MTWEAAMRWARIRAADSLSGPAGSHQRYRVYGYRLRHPAPGDPVWAYAVGRA